MLHQKYSFFAYFNGDIGCKDIGDAEKPGISTLSENIAMVKLQHEFVGAWSRFERVRDEARGVRWSVE